jgi:predicted AlkP superfamily pyrophosphatase or phosphodiesterase
MVSIDGLMPDAYVHPDAHGLAVPTLRALVSRGAYATAVASVFPTVTYPAHTTLATGVTPNVHRIVTNKPADALDTQFAGWRWYAEDIAVPTLWRVAAAQHREVALVTWPVTVGASVAWLVPEYWRAGGPDDQKLLRALSTPGLLDRVAHEYPSLWHELTPPDVHDDAQFAIATYLVTHEHPDLVMMHVWAVDDAQHDHGPWSKEAKAAIENADALLGRFVATLEAQPAWQHTTLVVVSDHGFAPIDHEIRLNALFARKHLIELDAAGKTKSARVAVIASGGSAFVYVLDQAARPEIEAAVNELASGAIGERATNPELGDNPFATSHGNVPVGRAERREGVAASAGPVIAKILGHDEVVAAGGDRDAAFVVVAAPGYSFGDARTGAIIVDTPGRGTHGWPPTDPAMAASFIAVGPNVVHRDLGQIRMVDIAPTVAHWLGIELPAAGAAIL